MAGGIRALFREREFVAYFVARQGAALGSSVEDVAIGWQIYSLRHSPLDLGLVGLVLFIPQVLLAVPAGLLADRFDRRFVCIVATIVQIVGLCGFVALILLGVKSLAINLAVVAFVGIGHSMSAPASRSLLARIVTGQAFVRAQALANTAGELVQIGGPALAGLLIALTTPLAFGFAAASYAIATMAYAFLHPREPVVEDVPLAQAARDGLHFIFNQKVILGAISLDLFAVLFGGAVVLLPVFATSILHVGPTGFGFLRAAPGVGAAIAAAIIARRSIERHAGAILFYTVAGFGISTIVFGLSKNFALSLAALAFAGGFDMVSVVIRQALVQLGTPDALRGRVSAIENVFIGASNELGAFESGTLAAFIGSVGSVVAGGAATLVVIALWALLFPQLRRFDRLDATPSTSL